MGTITCRRCGSVDDYSTSRSGQHIKATCNKCGSYIQFVPQGGPPTLFFGKYKGREISTMITVDEINYLHWLLDQDIKEKLREDIQNHIHSLKFGYNG